MGVATHSKVCIAGGEGGGGGGGTHSKVFIAVG